MERFILDLPEDILLIIFGLLSCKLPWKSIKFIFGSLKISCQSWNKLITVNTTHICTLLEIPKLHFLAGTNRSDKIIDLFLNTNCSLRAPDKLGYSPACYACGNHMYKSMKILKMGYALNTICMDSDKLHSFMETDLSMHILLTEKLERKYPHKEIKNLYNGTKAKFLEELLIWDTATKEKFLNSNEVKQHIKSHDHPLKNLIIYMYKNSLINRFFGTINGICDEKIIELFLENNINFNTCDENGNTFLHHAINRKQLTIVNFLLDCKNIDVNIQNSKFTSPLRLSVNMNDIRVIKLLVGTNNIIYDDFAMEDIFYNNKLDYLNLILEHGYKPTIKHLIVALCIGIRKKSIAQMEYVYILSKILNINIPRGDICLSNLFKDENMRNLLITHGIRLIELLIVENAFDCLDFLLSFSNKYSATSDIGPGEPISYIRTTSLSYAINFGHTECMRILIKYGADVNLITEGYSILHDAVYQFRTINCFKLLLDSGIDINACINDENNDRNGYTTLHLATIYDNINIVKLLLERGADKTLLTKSGFTAKELAEQNEHTEIASIL